MSLNYKHVPQNAVFDLSTHVNIVKNKLCDMKKELNILKNKDVNTTSQNPDIARLRKRLLIFKPS
jgi:hypothetical protein